MEEVEEEDTVCILRMTSKLLSHRRTKVMIGASRPALATTNKNNRVYRLTTLPTETIFSIRLVGLTKHHVFVVYQRRSHPCRPEGRLNHLIY